MQIKMVGSLLRQLLRRPPHHKLCFYRFQLQTFQNLAQPDSDSNIEVPASGLVDDGYFYQNWAMDDWAMDDSGPPLLITVSEDSVTVNGQGQFPADSGFSSRSWERRLDYKRGLPSYQAGSRFTSGSSGFVAR